MKPAPGRGLLRAIGARTGWPAGQEMLNEYADAATRPRAAGMV